MRLIIKEYDYDLLYFSWFKCPADIINAVVFYLCLKTAGSGRKSVGQKAFSFMFQVKTLILNFLSPIVNLSS